MEIKAERRRGNVLGNSAPLSLICRRQLDRLCPQKGHWAPLLNWRAAEGSRLPGGFSKPVLNSSTCEHVFTVLKMC